MIYVVTENGEPYTYHTIQEEAEKYIRELRQVYPQSDWDMDLKKTGRLPGQAEMIWGAECVVDALDHTIYQWMKVYLWRGMTWTPPAVGENIYRFIPMIFENTDENKSKSVIESRLAGMRFEVVAPDRVVRTR